jgi:phage gp36-like protein
VAGYTTPADLRLILARNLSGQGPDVDQTGTAADLSDGQLQDAIDTATAEIDASLSNRFTVPFPSPFPAMVVHVCKAIAAWHANAISLESADIGANDPVQRRFEWAKDMLTKIASGDIDLPDLTSATGTDASMVAFPAYDGVMFWPGNFGVGYQDQGLWDGIPSGSW